MNATGPKDADGMANSVHVTHCVHTSMNIRKMKFIS